MDAFNGMMQDTGLVDMGFNGLSYTWTNNSECDQRICERLDRAITNAYLIGKYPNVRVTHKLLLGSDHCPLMVQIETQARRGTKWFRFGGAWLEQNGCEYPIKDTWTTWKDQGEGPNINNKLGRCRIKLTQWSKESMVNYKRRIEELQKKLTDIKKQQGWTFGRQEEV